ncbi:vancomycin high temperature exclusion protein [Adlercreutzia sp. ZJ138]|uniref:SanA/YdcF family protein n=1 Tax=Adlercreutzia sp. ZJ138 TaxID=2709405 RepID=UPI0013ECEC39|nr:ElyC/SanA/YdcF family protein [Adlercreutzia sp. ZJ138]
MKRLSHIALACVIACAIVVGGSNAWVIGSTKSSILTHEEAIARVQSENAADAIVVLGAGLRADATPSSILRDRLDDGIALYFAGLAPKLIMSGDNATVSHNEVAAMKAYAIEKGVPSEDIFCDHAGFSTYDSMYRAQNIFGASSIVVATQSYHLPRALAVAQTLGMEAVGVPSDYENYGAQLWYDVREIPARTKDLFKAIMRTPSTVGGEMISLNQSGNVTN